MSEIRKAANRYLYSLEDAPFYPDDGEVILTPTHMKILDAFRAGYLAGLKRGFEAARFYSNGKEASRDWEYETPEDLLKALEGEK